MIVTAIVALTIFRQPSLYRATAVLRLAGERRATLTSGMEETPVPDRFTAPLNSLVPRVLSRGIVGTVVDSLGLQLQPVPVPLVLRPPAQPKLGLTNVRVDANARPDTLILRFSGSDLTIEQGGQSRKSPYGKPIKVGAAEFTVPAAPEFAGAVVALVPRDVAIDRLLSRLAAVPLPTTDALQVRYIDTDPARAQRVANQMVQTFYQSTITSSQAQAQRRRIFLEGQLRETERVLSQAQGNLTGFRSRRQLASSSEKAARQQVEMVELDSRGDELRADRRVFQSLLSRLETSNDSARAHELRMLAYSPEFAGDALVGKVLQQLLTYRTRLDSLTTGPWRYSATNPDVVQLRQLVRSTEGELVRAVRARVSGIDERLAALGDRRSATSGRIAALPALEAEEARLDQKVAGLGEFENQLRLEYEKSRISEALAAGDIEIVDLASLPYLPVGVPWWLKVGVAMVFGLIMAVVISILMEMRNRSIREPEELEEVLRLRGLGVIPPVARVSIGASGLRRLRGLGKRLPSGAVAEWPTESAGTEAFRLLYGSLTSASGWGQRRQKILVTSVGPQEGKTLIAANLAVTYAREGARVLLIDCDLRRPRLHKMFQVPRVPGLVEALNLESMTEPVEQFGSDDEPKVTVAAFSMVPDLERPKPEAMAGATSRVSSASTTQADDDVADVPPAAPERLGVRGITATSVKRLSLLPCGAMQQNFAGALNAKSFRRLLRRLDESFNVIILDTPPALVSADAVILAQLADDVLMVIRAGRTDREAAERAYQQLTDAGAHVVGAVLNDPEGCVGRDRELYYAYDYPVTGD
jgi:Mrp family chromosome partitioning ATPase/uncharacterized protein involved in exopolysaccharide biosynthesis